MKNITKNGRGTIPNNLTLTDAYRELNARECDVLILLGEGKTNRQIADELFISEDTVENHITKIGKKLSMSGRGNVRRWIMRVAAKQGNSL